ncbi:hypothetical protein T4B_14705, partial [Trichinella pseudospiralis]
LPSGLHIPQQQLDTILEWGRFLISNIHFYYF